MTDFAHMKLGKKPGVVIDRRTLMLAAYVGTDLPTSPSTSKVTAKIPDDQWGMLLNDDIGDCGLAAQAHMDMAWDRRTRKRQTAPTEDDVLKAYVEVGGYRPGDPSTDNGVYLLDALNHWRTTGLAGEKIAAFAAVDAHNRMLVDAACWLFGGLYIGLALPLSAQRQPSTWDFVVGPDSAPGSWGHHCVNVIGYGVDWLDCVTWGRRVRMTRRFFQAYCDEAYAVLSPDWLGAKSTSPAGFDRGRLLQDLARVTKR